MTVSDHEGSMSSEGAAVYCDRHGVKAVIEALPRGHDQIYRSLLEVAHAKHIDWIAMGAFGHSRLRERFFGGVTQAMLEYAPIPLFLFR